MRNVQIEVLKRVPLFKSLGRRELRHVAEAGNDLEFPPGATIVHEGMTGTDFYLIESGTAHVTKGDRILRELGQGDFFGELGILYSIRRSASVLAKTQLWLFRLDRQAFIDLLDHHGVIARKVLMEVARRTRPADAADLA